VLFQPVTRVGRMTAVLAVGFFESRQRVPAPALYLVELLAAEIGAAIDRADLPRRHVPTLSPRPQIAAAGTRPWTASWLAPAAPATRSPSP
jgi:hypothetical protein